MEAEGINPMIITSYPLKPNPKTSIIIFIMLPLVRNGVFPNSSELYLTLLISADTPGFLIDFKNAITDKCRHPVTFSDFLDI